MFLSWRVKPHTLWVAWAVGLGGGLYILYNARRFLGSQKPPKPIQSSMVHIPGHQLVTPQDAFKLLENLLDDLDDPNLRSHVLHGATTDAEHLDWAITAFQKVVGSSLPGSPGFPVPDISLSKALGILLEFRFQQNGNSADLDEAITHHQQALDLSSTGHPDYSSSLNNLAIALRIRFQQLGDMEDMDQAIICHQQGLELCPIGNPHHSSVLYNLAFALGQRFQQQGDIKDLDQAIIYHQQELSLCPTNHPEHPQTLTNLAVALSIRFEKQGDIEDLDQAITYHQQALELYCPGHPLDSSTLIHLAIALTTRFGKQGDTRDLDQAITYYHQALDLYPIGHPHHPSTLTNLVVALVKRYEQQGDMGDLDQAITYSHQALNLFPSGHPYHSACLSNLANALSIQLEHQGNAGDLDQAIIYHQQALGLNPVGHSERPASLNNLAAALQARFGQQGHMGDLDQAISLIQQGLRLCPIGHPRRPSSLSTLGSALHIRFEQQGNLEDLDHAITYHQEALGLRPSGHPEHPLSLSNLAAVLGARFNQQGDMADMDQAIVYHQEALEQRPIGHPARSSSLHNLAIALSERFDQQGGHRDLGQAIAYHQQALGLRPTGHPHHSCSLSSLGSTLHTRFEQQGDPEDLEQAITYHQQALGLCPTGHPDHASSLNNLAIALVTQFKQQGDLGDLDQAITYRKQALALRPSGHPNHSSSLNNLASALSTRFQQQGDIADLDQAILLYEELHVTPSHHPHQLALTQGLAKALLLHPQATDLADKAFSLFHQAVSQVPAGFKARLFVSSDWIRLAKQNFHPSELLAYSTALGLLQQYITLHPTIQSQLSALVGLQWSLGSDAAACAIQRGQLGGAIELLEQGRAILWRSVGGYRSNLEELKEAGHEKLAWECQRLGNLLEHTTLSSAETSSSGKSMAEEAQMYHQVAKEWDHVITQIQEIDGFNHFLTPTPFSMLQHSAFCGPVIIVNISRYHSDALVIQNKHDPILVPLPSATPEAIGLLTSSLQSSLAGDNPRKRAMGVISVLRSLWDWVAQPVVDHLSWLPQGSQIWWCPTSALCSLPLHAAGNWRTGQPNLSDMFLSSYTPTLSTLLRVHARDLTEATKPSLLAIGVSEPFDGSGKLGNVKGELDQVRDIGASKGQYVNFLEDGHATRHTVLNALQQHSWVHFSCHGQQKFNQPFNSCFLLHDAPLTLHDIIQSNIPNAELAFLSACHTASGNQRRPDETIHLAAALQFSGFKTVIGTLWAMDDEDGPDVAKAFYNYMFRNGAENLDHRDAAEALKCVVETLRRKGVPVDRWANFIHIGA